MILDRFNFAIDPLYGCYELHPLVRALAVQPEMQRLRALPEVIAVTQTGASLVNIIYSDNIPTDTSSETLWLAEVPSSVAQRICDKLNEHLDNRQGPYYKPVSIDHKLYKWEP